MTFRLFQIALHFNPRPEQGKIVLNTATKHMTGKKATHKWGREMYFHWPDHFKKGDEWALVLTIDHRWFEFEINGHKEKQHYNHRMKYEDITAVQIGGPTDTVDMMARSE